MLNQQLQHGHMSHWQPPQLISGHLSCTACVNSRQQNLASYICCTEIAGVRMHMHCSSVNSDCCSRQHRLCKCRMEACTCAGAQLCSQQ